MTSINIIARNNCKLNVNISGNYNVALTGVTGPYNIVLLKAKKDYLEIRTKPDTRLMNKEKRIEAWKYYIKQEEDKGDEANQATINEMKEKLKKAEEDITTKDYVQPDLSTGFIEEKTENEAVSYEYVRYTQRWKCFIQNDVITTYSVNNVVKLVNDMFSKMTSEHSNWTNLIEYIDSYSKFKFTNIEILEASEGFSYLLGIPTKVPENTEYSTTIPVFNGTPYLFLKCNKLRTALRYCWQTDPKLINLSPDEKYKAMYSNVQRIISVSPNNNMINQPFSLGGGQFTADGNDLTDVEFTITGIHGEEIEFASDLLWSFELTPLPDEDLSKLPGLLSPEMLAQLQGQNQPPPQDGQQMPIQQQPQQNEQQITKPSDDGLMKRGLNNEEEIIKPSDNGLMKKGLPRMELIK